MELKALPTDIVLSDSKTVLGHIKLDRSLYPGTYVDIDGHTYQILVRRHQYQLKLGRYHLHKAVVHVKETAIPEERTLLNGDWVLVSPHRTKRPWQGQVSWAPSAKTSSATSASTPAATS